MKRLILFLFLASCTVHQGERLQEVFLTGRRSAALRDEHLVRDALLYSSAASVLTVEKLDALSLPLGSNAYALQGLGLPQGERMLLASYDPLRDQVVVHLEFALSEDNRLQISGEAMDQAPLVLKHLLQGQEVELALVSKEKRTCSRMRFIPHPIFLEDQGALYTLETIHRKGTHFLLHGQGLAPHEPFTLREQSENEVREHAMEADAEGRFTQRIEPIVFGRLGGRASVTLFREGLPPSQLTYLWGGKLEASSSREARFCPLVFAVDRFPEERDLVALQPALQKILTI